MRWIRRFGLLEIDEAWRSELPAPLEAPEPCAGRLARDGNFSVYPMSKLGMDERRDRECARS